MKRAKFALVWDMRRWKSASLNQKIDLIKKLLILSTVGKITFRKIFFQISGEGFAANLMKKILQIFNPITRGSDVDDRWRKCFSEPNPPDYLLFQLMLFLYILSILMCFVQVPIPIFFGNPYYYSLKLALLACRARKIWKR